MTSKSTNQTFLKRFARFKTKTWICLWFGHWINL